MTDGTCAATTCTDGVVVLGACTATPETCSNEDTLTCTAPAVLDSDASCATDTCVSGDFGTVDKACCKGESHSK